MDRQLTSIALAGRLIRNARVMNRETLKQVADKIGVSTAYLSSIESAKSVPTPQLAEKISRSLDLDLLELMGLYNKLPEQVSEQLSRHDEIRELLYAIGELRLSQSEEREVYREIRDNAVKYVADKFKMVIDI